MARTLTALCACALVFAAAFAQEQEPAAAEEPFVGNENGYSLLIARRTFLGDSFVQGRPMKVRVQIWNIGTKFVNVKQKHYFDLRQHITIQTNNNREAENVEITENYPKDMFTEVEAKSYDKILAFVSHHRKHISSFRKHLLTHKQTKINRTNNVTYEYTVTPNSNGEVVIPRTTLKYDDKVAHIDADLRLLVESPAQYAKRTDRHIVCSPKQAAAKKQAQNTCVSQHRSTGSSTLWRRRQRLAARCTCGTPSTRRSSEKEDEAPRLSPHPPTHTLKNQSKPHKKNKQAKCRGG